MHGLDRLGALFLGVGSLHLDDMSVAVLARGLLLDLPRVRQVNPR